VSAVDLVKYSFYLTWYQVSWYQTPKANDTMIPWYQTFKMGYHFHQNKCRSWDWSSDSYL